MIERLNVQPVSVIVHMDRYLIGPENLSLNAKEEFAELCRSSGSSIGADCLLYTSPSPRDRG